MSRRIALKQVNESIVRLVRLVFAQRLLSDVCSDGPADGTRGHCVSSMCEEIPGGGDERRSKIQATDSGADVVRSGLKTQHLPKLLVINKCSLLLTT